MPDEDPVPPAVVTVMWTAPATWGAVTAVILVGLVTVKLVTGVEPNLTAVAPSKPVPVMVTVVVPEVVPVAGVNDVTVTDGATNL